MARAFRFLKRTSVNCKGVGEAEGDGDAAEETAGAADGAAGAGGGETIGASFRFLERTGGATSANQQTEVRTRTERRKIVIRVLTQFSPLRERDPRRKSLGRLRLLGRQWLTAPDDLVFRRELLGLAAENDPVGFLGQRVDERFRVRCDDLEIQQNHPQFPHLLA